MVVIIVRSSSSSKGLIRNLIYVTSLITGMSNTKMLTPKLLSLAIFVRIGLCQTPMDFQPGSQAKLGIRYPSIEITPTGTDVNSLDSK
jgi:hypothetical protein